MYYCARLRPMRGLREIADYFRECYGKIKDFVNAFNPFNRDISVREIMHAEKYRNEGLHWHNESSKLKPISVMSDKGNEKETYQHFNRYNQTVDIDFEKPVKIGTFGDKGIIMQEYNNVTVKLNENNEIDFSLPENQGLLQQPEMISQIIKQYPESFGTLPISMFENDKNKKSLLQAFNEGVNDRVAKNKMGVNERGDKRTEAQYLQDMMDIGMAKRQEYQKLMAARAEFGREMGDDW